MMRETCGTLRGAIAHLTAGEPQCGWCQHAERCARLSAEATAKPPLPLGGESLEPVSMARAALNRSILDAEVLAFEQEHPGGHSRGWRDDPVVPFPKRGAA